tara:strand:- start:80650 stop:82422 length:1773 start_codon:yes stop_codon:yes gene_type:complete
MKILELYRLYRQHIGNKFYILFVMQLLSALFEGVGIALVLPLLSRFGTSGGGSNDSDFIENILEKIGLPTSDNWLVILIVLAFYSKAIILFLNGAYQAKITSHLEYEVRKDVITAMNGSDFSAFSTFNSGHYMNLIISQVKKAMFAFSLSVIIVSGMLYSLVFLGLAFWLNWSFAALVILLGSGALFVFRYIGRKVKRISTKDVEANNKLGQLCVQYISGFKYLKATQKMDAVLAHLFEVMQKLKEYFYKKQLASAFSQAINEPILLTVLVAAVFISVNYFEAVVSTLLVSILVIYRALGRMMKVQGSWQALMAEAGSVEFLLTESKRFKEEFEVSGVEKPKNSEKMLTFENVSFNYPSGEKAIRNVSFTVKRNETLAIVGESGSGKSTLLDLITAIQKPTSGTIFYLDIPNDQVDLINWRSRIGYVTQDVLMFDDSIRNNVTLWDAENAETIEAKLKNSIEMANASDFILGKEVGLSSEIGDRGLKLSGGQKQRISIARELYKEPEILILDEATSALDTESEKVIKESIDKLKGSLTVILVAHRLSTVQNADKIIVMDKGSILEQGDYESLVQAKGRFYDMVTLQNMKT